MLMYKFGTEHVIITHADVRSMPTGTVSFHERPDGLHVILTPTTSVKRTLN